MTRWFSSVVGVLLVHGRYPAVNREFSAAGCAAVPLYGEALPRNTESDQSRLGAEVD